MKNEITIEELCKKIRAKASQASESRSHLMEKNKWKLPVEDWPSLKDQGEYFRLLGKQESLHELWMEIELERRRVESKQE